MRFLTFIIIIINIFLKPLIGQDLNNQKIKISIRQECYPGPNPIFTYKVSGKRFTIEKTKYIIRESIKVTDDIYTLKLNKTQEDSLKIILSKIDLTKFESSYTSAILDGIAWDFNLTQARRTSPKSGKSSTETKRRIFRPQTSRHGLRISDFGLRAFLRTPSSTDTTPRPK